MNTADASLPEFLVDKRQLAEGESFDFTCHPGVPCFNSCCADVNIVLTPFDVLRLARRLGMNTQDFLETHTSNPITKDLQIPMVMLKMKEGRDYERYCGKSLEYVVSLSEEKELEDMKTWDVAVVAELADFVTKNAPTHVSRAIVKDPKCCPCSGATYKNVDCATAALRAVAAGNLAYMSINSTDATAKQAMVDAYAAWQAS